MCGLAGIFDVAATSAVALELTVRAMAECIEHRGPDASGVWIDQKVGLALGHRRLSIIDLSSAGAQPMTSASRRYVIAFNGEIYNYRELQRLLEGKGVRFCGHSDTEVLLAAIDEWGLEDAVWRLDGMFAFAVWDRQEHVLSLARDRFGEKPMYWGWNNGRLLFGSELGAIESAASGLEINPEAVRHLVTQKCIPAPLSIYRQIEKLEPATIATVRRDGSVKLAQYWSAIDTAIAGIDDPLDISEGDATDELVHRLRDAVGSRMVADVRVGAFLSGGVDSAGVVAFMQATQSAPVPTFTVGYEDHRYDETAGAEAVAAHLGTKHTSLRVSAEDVRSLIPQLSTIYDEPFADSSQLPSVLVSRLAAKELKVVLTGDGGDEVFGGYNRHIHARRVQQLRQFLPRSTRRLVDRAIGGRRPEDIEAAYERVRPVLPNRLQFRLPAEKLVKLGRALGADSVADSYDVLVRDIESAQIMSDGLGLQASSREHLADQSLTAQMMILDAVSFLPSDILTKVDRASMSAGLEARAPYLSASLFAFAWRLPMDMKVSSGIGKRVLRQAIQSQLGDFDLGTIKHGFGIPVGDWLRGDLHEWGRSMIEDVDDGVLDTEAVHRVWDDHQAGRADHMHVLWSILMLRSWLADRPKLHGHALSPGVSS